MLLELSSFHYFILLSGASDKTCLECILDLVATIYFIVLEGVGTIQVHYIYSTSVTII